jgi:hypothetical protein
MTLEHYLSKLSICLLKHVGSLELSYWGKHSMYLLPLQEEKLVDTKEVIRSRCRTDIAMAKWKRRKGQTMLYKTLLHRKLKIVQHEQHKTDDELRCSGRVSTSCSTSGSRRVYLATNPVISHEWEKNRMWLRQTDHIRGHLWHRYS